MLSKFVAVALCATFVFADHGDDSSIAEVVFSVANNVEGDGVATADDTSATGSGDVFWDEDTHLLSWELEWSDLTSDVTSVQFRGPAAAGETSDTTIHQILGTPTSPNEGDVTLSDANGITLEDNMVYIVINTENYPNGEIRAQVMDFAEQEDFGAKTAPLLIVTVFVSVATVLLV